MIDGSITMSEIYVLDHQHRESINLEYSHWLRIDQTIRLWLFATLSVEMHDVKFYMIIWT